MTDEAQQPPGAMSVRQATQHVEALLDDDGHFNPDGGISRKHPDYDPDSDERAQPPDRERDSRGRFKKAAESEGDDELVIDDDELEAAGDDPDEDTQTGDTDEDIAASADDDAPTGDEDTGAIETLAQLAEALEIDITQLQEGLSHTFNAAGEEVTVTLAELMGGYQKDADYRRSTAKLAEQRQAQEAEFQARHQTYEQANHLLAAQLQLAEQVVAAELEDPRLAELRAVDPGEWTARREEIGTRLQKLRGARIEAAQRYSAFVENSFNEFKTREIQALQTAIPNFGEDHRTRSRELFTSFGYSPQEIDQIVDHRLIMGALELADLRQEVAELRKLKETAEDTAKRVKKDVPKLLKKGKQKRQTPAGLNRDNIARLRKRAAKSGSVDDAAKVIEHMI